MKNKFLGVVATIGLAVLLFTGCAKMPQTEIDGAKEAIENAKVAGAEMYVQADFIALQDSMKAATEAIEAQKSKFFKKYDEAKAKLAGVTTYAQEVQTKVEARKEEIKNEIQAIITETNGIVASNRQLITEAPKGKEGASALMAITDENNIVDATVSEAGTMLQNGDLLAAMDKANVAKTKAMSINQELQEVIAKVMAKSKKAPQTLKTKRK